MANNQLFELYKQLIENPKSNKVFYTYYSQAKNEFKKLIDNTFTLETYKDTKGFSLLKDYLIDRYAKLFAFAKFVSLQSTSFKDLPENLIDEIFLTFGFTFSKYLNENDKRTIVQNIVDLINKKGTKILAKVIQTVLKLSDVDILDLDLILDRNGEWVLIDPKTGVRFLGADVESDNHWLTKVDDLRKRTNQRQFRTPFFTLTTHRYKIDDLTKGVLFINLLVRDELRYYAKNNQFQSKIHIDLFDIDLSVAELWLLIVSLFGVYADVYNAKLNDQPCGVVVFDHDTLDKDEIKTQSFEKTAKIINSELKQLTYQFYLSNFDRLEDVTFEEFDSYLASQWSDYYALDEHVRNAYVSSAFFFMKLAKIEIPRVTIDSLWDSCNQIVDYCNKYVSYDRKDVGLLYIFYDLFVRYYTDDSSEIVRKIIKTPLAQLNIINPKLYRFVQTIRYKLENESLSRSDVRNLLIYLLNKLSLYIFETYLIHIPFEIIFGSLSSLYSTKIIQSIYDDLKPIYARPLSSNNSMHMIIDNALLYSVVYDDHSLYMSIKNILKQAYDPQDKIEQISIRLRLNDLFGGLTHLFYYLDPNHIAFLLNRFHKLHINCCNANDYLCISNFKAIKEWWLCCSNENSKFAIYNRDKYNTKPYGSSTYNEIVNYCHWCDKHSYPYYNIDQYNNTTYYTSDTPPPYVTKVSFSSIDPKCLGRKVHDGLLIPTYYFKTKRKTLKVDYQKKRIVTDDSVEPSIYDRSHYDSSYYDSEGDSLPILNLHYFDTYKYVTNEEIEKWLLDAIKDRDLYTSDQIVDDLLNHPILKFIAYNYDYQRMVINQLQKEELFVTEVLSVANITTKLSDSYTIKDFVSLTLKQKINDLLNLTDDLTNKLIQKLSSIQHIQSKLHVFLDLQLISYFVLDDSELMRFKQKLYDTLTILDSSKNKINHKLTDSFTYSDSLSWDIIYIGKYDSAIGDDKHYVYGL